MGRNISIAISAQDNFSQAVNKMRDAGIHFNKNLEEMDAQLKLINKNRVTLRVETKEAQKNLREIEKECAAAKKSQDGMVSPELQKRLEDANAEYERMKQNLGLLDRAARDTQKSMNAATGEISKLENRAGSSGAKDSFLGGLASAGLIKLGSDTAANVFGTFLESWGGSDTSTIFSNLLSGMGSGAAIGAVAGFGLPGAVVGGAAGLISGGFNAATQIFGKEDDAFKAYAQEQYNTVQQYQQDALTSGIAIAERREQDRLSFKTLMGGQRIADKLLDDILTMSNSTPFLYDDLTAIAKQLSTYGYGAAEIMDQLQGIGGAGAAIGWSAADMQAVAQQIGFMKESETVNAMQLKQLLRKGINPYEILGEAYDMSQSELLKAVSGGKVSGEEASGIISSWMQETFADSMAEQSLTYAGLESTLQGKRQNQDAAMGVGYAQVRSVGMQEEIAHFDSEAGKATEEAYKMIGMFQASLKNKAEQLERDAINAVFTGTVSEDFSDTNRGRLAELNEQYQEALRLYGEGSEEAGCIAGSLFAEAQAIAQNEYNSSEGAKLARESDLQLVKDLQNDASIQQEYYNYGLLMGKQFNKGLISTAEGRNRFFVPDGGGEFQFSYDSAVNGDYGAGNAYGLSYVPYDDYPARLHEGERVLTASEAREYNAGRPGNITININGEFTVREEDDIDRIAAELARRLKQTQMLM